MCILILPYEQSLGKSCRDVDFEFVQWTNKKLQQYVLICTKI